MLTSKDIKKITGLLFSTDDVSRVIKRLDNIEELTKEINKKLN